jgi:hypothetical protein
MKALKALLSIGLGCVIACGASNKGSETLPENQRNGGDERGSSPLADGDYLCTMTQGQYTYDPLWCVVLTTANGQRLEKRQGSHLFQGDVQPEGDGFLLTGLWCESSCDQPFKARFASASDGTFRADVKLAHATWQVKLQRAPMQGAYGGRSYGSAAYGGRGYGGSRYGIR